MEHRNTTGPDELPEALAWVRCTETLELSAKALEKMQSILDNPPQPSERLQAAAKRCMHRVE
jgi:uncharacterized protein (DUF1778 family)